MKQVFFSLLFVLAFLPSKAQSCTSTTYFDNMETYTWLGDWWLYNFSNFYTNFSVSPSVSAMHYGSGSSTSGIEQDWYTMPVINGLNPNYSYKVRFKLASYTVTSSTATTRGVDADDYIQVQLSRNGGAYVTEMTVRGFSNQTWTYNATGVAAKTANGTNTIYQRTTGGARLDGYSTIELTLQPNTTSVAIDIYTRCNSAGEEFWLDNIQLIETIPTQTPVIFGDSSVCAGDPITLTAVGGNTFSWSNGVTNGVSFTPSITTNYTVTATFNGMVNGNGTFQTCPFTQSKLVTVDNNCALPISLVSFTGENKDNINVLYWITDVEYNSSHFEIEKSADGIVFEVIGSIIADQNNPYEFIDEMPIYSNNYYRLKMVDLDLSFTYSPIIVVEVEKPTYDYIISPNPFDNSITYTYYEEIPEHLYVEICNEAGQVIDTVHIVCESCINRVPIDLNHLSAGHYIIKITHTTTGITRTQRIIKK